MISPDPGFLDSLKMIAAPVQSFADWQAVWPAFIGLFFFGMILNYCAVRTRSLYPSIGLHAGCVFFIRLDDLCMSFQGGKSLLWGSKILYDGVVGWLSLILVAAFLWKILKPQSAKASEIPRDPKTV